MMPLDLAILSAGSYCDTVSGEAPTVLKDLVKESTGVSVRRVSRFVQLALIGAGRCARDQELSEHTGIYFSSCRGDIDVTAELLNDMIRRQEMPKPLTFVNSVSNAACFHVASVLGLKGRSNFITNRFDPLAAAIKSAQVDLALGEVDMALVGSVDVSSWPLSHHRQRVEVGPDQPVAEASHWFLLVRSADCCKPAVRIRPQQNFCDWTELKQWLESRSFVDGTVLAPGQHLQEATAAEICKASGITQQWSYRDQLPHYDSQLGVAVDAFIASSLPVVLHVNSDPSGRFSTLLLEREQI